MGPLAYFGLCLLGCLLFNPTVEGARSRTLIRPRSLCPPGALHYGRACYEFLDNPLKWKDAELSCQFQRNGHLASINSKKEEYFITQYIKELSCPSEIWIGFTVTNQTWGWSDGSQYIKGSALWDGRRPGEAEDDRCISLTSVKNPKATERWQKVFCTETYPYLCKYPALY